MYHENQPDLLLLQQRAQARWDESSARGDFTALNLNDAASGYIQQLQRTAVELEWQLAEAKRVNELLTAALNGVPDSVFVKDLAGRYQLFNEAAAIVAGRSCDKMIGNDDRHLFGTVEAERIMAEDQQILRSCEPYIAEQDLTIGNEVRTFATTKRAYFDSQGVVQGIVGTARDMTEIRQAQNRLSESEKRFRTLADNMPDCLYLLDPDDPDCPCKILYANNAAAENDGYLAEQLVGRSLLTLLDTPDSAAPAAERIRRVMRGEVVEFQVEHVHRLGHRVPYEVRAVNIPWQGRSLILGINRNITARREADAIRRESEARLTEAQEIGGVGSFEIDLPGWQGRCSPVLCKIFGFDNDDVFRDYQEFIRKYRHLDDNEPDELHACGTTGAIEQRYLHPNGEVRILHIRRKVIRNAVSMPVKLVGTVQDVTERRQAEEKLRASEARYRTFVDHVSDAMFLHHADSTVLDVNQQACDSLGLSREELIGKKPLEFDPQVTAEQIEAVRARLDAGESLVLETQHRRRDGSTFPVEIRARPFWVDGQRFSISMAHDITARKQSEEALRASAQRFRELADAIPQIVFTAAPDGWLNHLNARATQYTGLELDGLTGWSWEQVIHPDDLAATVRDWTELLTTGIPRQLEFRIRRADGEYRWHIARQTAGRDAEGNVTQWYGTCTDIEDLKRAEHALRSSEERYRKLFDSIPDAMFVYDPRSLRCITVNDAAVEKYGYSRSEFSHLTINDIRVVVDEKANLSRHRRKNGEWIDVEFTAHALELDGRPVLISLVRDVTDRLRAEAELQRTSELLRVVAEGTPDAVFVKDLSGKYLLFNPAAASFVGKPAAEVLGKDDTALFGPADAAIVQGIDRQVIESQRPHTNEETLTAAGVTRTYLAMKAPYRDGNGQIMGTIGISRDITERKQAEKELARRQEELRHVSRLNSVGQMVAALSHEVAQPLAAISNYAASSSALLKPESLKKKENLEQVRLHIDQIAQQSRRAAEVIYRLRDYSRKSAPQRVECNLNELLRHSVEMVSLELRGAEINLTWDLAVDLPHIAGDHIQLQQVVVNLLLNARDSLLESTALSRKIALRSRVDLGKIVIEVEDNGSGMSEEIAGRLYEPFVTTKLQGMGIGLNICRSILQEHRGEIDYHQVATGGVLFRVSLPLNETSSTSP